MARHVLQHHDGIVHHKAGGDGQRHQRQVVQAVAHPVHHRKGTGQRHRHRHAGDDCRAQAPQKQAHHHNHQANGNHQRLLNFMNRGAQVGRAIRHHLHLHAVRQRGQQLRHQGAHPLHGLNHIGAGLLVQNQQNRGLAIGGAVIAQVLHRVDHLGHIAQTHHPAFAVTHDQGRIVCGGARLVIGLDLPGTVAGFHQALGAVGVAAHHRLAHRFQ